jgi:GAF domain-containing protein
LPSATKRSRSRQRFAKILKIINSSPGDLQLVFAAILEEVHRLCGVSHGSLQLYKDGRFRAVATRDITAEAAARLRQAREPGPAIKPLLAGARFHEIDDQSGTVAQSPLRFQSGRIDWRTQGLARRLFVPLRHDASLLGVIVAGRTEVRPFSDKEISAAGELRAAGGHRDAERAADHRDARGAGATDRHCRRARRDQLLAR